MTKKLPEDVKIAKRLANGAHTYTYIKGLKDYLNTVCPVNNNSNLIVSEKSFLRMCAAHRAKKVGSPASKYADKYGLCYNPCQQCPRRKSIVAGKDFTPPTGVTFSDLIESISKETKDLYLTKKSERRELK